MKKLIINGDDFGFSEAYNYGMIKAFECGVMTSASIMPNMDAAVHAAALAKMRPRLCISLHTNIVQGSCCADPAEIPSIVRPDGTFYRSGEYKADGWAKKTGGTRTVDKNDFKTELLAQIERFKTLMGYYPVHIEGHSIGTEPIMQALLEVVREKGMHTMTFDENIRQEGFAHVGYHFKELATAGNMMGDYYKEGFTVETFLQMLEFLHKTGSDICAVHTHPGYVDAEIMDSSTLVLPRCRDLQTLCDPRVAKWIADNGIELIRYDEIRQ